MTSVDMLEPNKIEKQVNRLNSLSAGWENPFAGSFYFFNDCFYCLYNYVFTGCMFAKWFVTVLRF